MPIYKGMDFSILSKFTKKELNDNNIKIYKSKCKGLSHIRTGEDYKGYIYIDKNDNVVGFYNIRESDKYIQAIEVNKEYQGKGIGKLLLAKCIQDEAVRLSVRKNNTKAINMYKKDFKIVAEDENMYYMQLALLDYLDEQTNINENSILKEGEKMEFEGLNNNIIQEEYKEEKIIHIVEGNNIAELNKSFIKFNTYSYNEQLELDKICIEKYGQTNKQRYLELYDEYASRIYLNENIKESLSTEFDTDYVNRSYNNISFIDRLNDLPYFTPMDMSELGVYSNSETNYYGEPSNIENNDLKWYENYQLLYKGIYTNDFKELSNKRIDKIYELYYNLYNEYSNVNSIKQSILELGWNPEIPFTPENRIKATINNKERLKSILCTNEFFDATHINTDIIIEERAKETLHPIYVILVYTASPFGKLIKEYTHGIYTHAAMSLDNTLNKLYSYNLNNNYSKLGGFSIESIQGYIKDNKDAIMCVYTTFVNDEKKRKLDKQLNYFINNVDKTKYSILNVLSLVANKPIELANDMICSQFVDRMLKLVDIDITGMASSLVTPNDIYRSTSNKIYKIYEGRVDQYNYKKAQTIVNKLRKSSIVEAKSTPLQFDDNGDLLYIKDIKDIQEEYNKSHKLLLNYDKTGNYEAMKSELYKLWYLNLLLERKIYNKKKSNKEYYDMRSRILNDFNKYLKKVNQNDPEYIFSDGYNQSQYNDSIYKVHSSTLKYGIKYAKSMIGLFEDNNSDYNPLLNKYDLEDHHGVGVGIFKKDKILVMYHNKFDMLTIPVGKAKYNETPIKAAVVEVKEETDIDIKDLDEIDCFVTNEIRNGIEVEVTNHLYIAKAWIGKPKNMESHKHKWIRWMTIDEIKKYPLRKGYMITHLLDYLDNNKLEYKTETDDMFKYRVQLKDRIDDEEDEIRRIIKSLPKKEKEYLALDYKIDKVERDLKAKKNFNIIELNTGEMIGFIYETPGNPKTLELLYIVPKYRKMGAGTMAVDLYTGINKNTIIKTKTNNKPMISILKKLDFEIKDQNKETITWIKNVKRK